MTEQMPTTAYWTHDRGAGIWKDGAGREIPACPVQGPHTPRVPLIVAQEAWKEYDAQGHGSQSMERLNERGGFSWPELALLLYERIRRLEAAS